MKLRNRLFAASFAALAIGLSSQASAQALGIPPVRNSIDENRVDLISGQPSVSVEGVSIGNEESGMSADLIWVNGSWVHSLQTKFTFSWDYSNPLDRRQLVLVSIGGRSYSFRSTNANGVAWTSETGNGSTLVNGTNSYTFTDRDGNVFLFNQYAVGYGNATRQTKPEGEVLDFTYAVTSGYPSGGTTPSNVSRLQAVNSTAGYQAKFSYARDTIAVGSVTETTEWGMVKDIKLINSAVDYCAPSANSCTGLTQAWPSLNIGSSTAGGVTTRTVTDAQGNATSLTFDSNSKLTGVKRPGSASNDVTFGYDAGGLVNSVAVPGRTTTYTRTTGAPPPGSTTNTIIVTASDGVGTIRTTTLDRNKQVVYSAVDGIGRTTSYTYDSLGRPLSIAGPNGNFGISYDSRGNVVSLTNWTRVTGSPASVMLTAGFDSSCLSAAKCNKPNWTKDGLNNQTDYAYNTTTGQVLSVTQPAPSASAARPTSTYTYSNQSAWYKNSSGAIQQAPTPISKLVSTSTCLNAATCVGTANESKVVVAYQSGSASAASNLLPVSQTSQSGDGSVSSTTNISYDPVGNVTAVDGPLAGNADTTAFKYDALRRKVGEIGPDPDGTGTLINTATRTTFDAKGREVSVEIGTSNGQSDTAFLALAPASKTVTAYDNADRVLTKSVQSGGTTYGLEQYSYDARGRLDCSTVRLNSASFAAPPAACTLGTAGADGNDRITKVTYDLADQVTEVTTAYGTADAATEKFGYNSFGEVAWSSDANDNRTTYSYDGLDRLVKTNLPNPTTINTSSTTDYEQLTYDANSNVTSRRLRDGQSILFTYDNLGRLTYVNRPGTELDNSATYNMLGQPTQIQDSAGGFVGYAYDALGRTTAESSPLGVFGKGYDAAGRLTLLVYPDNFYVNYDYNSAGRLTAIRENGATSGMGVLATYGYDSLGRRTAVTRGNGTNSSFAFDALSRLTSLGHDLTGTAGDQTIGSVVYNPAGQITSQTKSNDSYAWGGHYNVNRNYTINGLNQMTLAGATSLGYDSRGNLTTSGASAYGYDSLNHLVSGPGTTLDYDPNDRLSRVVSAAGTTRFGYVGSQLLIETNATGTLLRRYVAAPGDAETIAWFEGSGTADRRWLHADERGTVVSVSDGSGALLAINRYDEYGIPQSGNIGRFGYTGQTWIGELGMWNYKARFYSPTLGRFMQTDPIGYGDGPNWYNYVGSDPVNLVDPLGLGQTPAKMGDTEPGCTPATCIFVTGERDKCPSGAFCVPDNRIEWFLQTYYYDRDLPAPELVIVVTGRKNKGNCVQDALIDGAKDTAADVIGLVPGGGGAKTLARAIGNRKGFRGVVADQFGKKAIRRTQNGAGGLGAIRDLANQDWPGIAFDVAGFIPGLGQGVAIAHIVYTGYNTYRRISKCP